MPFLGYFFFSVVPAILLKISTLLKNKIPCTGGAESSSGKNAPKRSEYHKYAAPSGGGGRD